MRNIYVLMNNGHPLIKDEDKVNAMYSLHEYEMIASPEECKVAIKFKRNFDKLIQGLND